MYLPVIPFFLVDQLGAIKGTLCSMEDGQLVLYVTPMGSKGEGDFLSPVT